MKDSFRLPPRLSAVAAAIFIAIGAATGPAAYANSDASVTAALEANVKTIVVIYAENRSFDNLFGNFPGAHGLAHVIGADGSPLPAYVPQRDRDGSLLPVLPQTWGGVTAAGVTPVVTQAQSANLPNAPFQVETAFKPTSGATLSTATTTRDLYHRFFENQMEIGDGSNDRFAAWADAGGLTMGHFDYSRSAIYGIARQYVLADNFFEGAFGGSFLNHQYLICACAPEYPNADAPPTGAKPTIAVLETDAGGHFLSQLKTAASSPASALDGPPVFVLSGNLAPRNYFGDGTWRAINTMQPPYQPSGNQPVDANPGSLPYANPAAATTLPPQTQTHIGNLLDAAGIGWAWYAGSWKAAVADGTQAPGTPRNVIYTPSSARAAPDFQAHHMPFNYFAGFDPATHAADRAAHLKDYDDLVAAAAAGTLPPVAFYKPQGNYNQHEGYANLDDGDQHLAVLISKLQASPQWPNMVIVVTYDEFGGVWDHVRPPKGDLIGPGTRIPAIVISPLAKKGTVDHTPYDTASVLRLVTRRYALPKLPGLTQRDAAMAANGQKPLGDLTNALELLPNGPAGLTATSAALRPMNATLRWSPVDGAVRYDIYVGDSAGGEGTTPVKSVGARPQFGPVTEVTDLQPGQTYYFKVVAVLDNGDVTATSNEASLTLRPLHR